MKSFFFFALFLLSCKGLAQEVSMSETLKIYEYSHVKEFKGTVDSLLTSFSSKMSKLSYTNVSAFSGGVKGESFFTKMISGSAMEVHYNAFVEAKDGRYKLTLNNFKITDVRYGTVAVETLGKSAQKKWVKFINENLPQIISNLESSDGW